MGQAEVLRNRQKKTAWEEAGLTYPLESVQANETNGTTQHNLCAFLCKGPANEIDTILDH